MTTYAPAVLDDGDVPLARATAFIGLAQDVTQEALLRFVDELVPTGDADEIAGSPAEAAAPRPVTVGDQAPTARADSEAGPARAVLSGFELFQAVTQDPDWAVRFAAVMVVGIDADGRWRDVTEAEASGARFPARAFAEAWPPFYEVSSRLTAGLLGTPSATASSSAETPRPTTTLA